MLFFGGVSDLSFCYRDLSAWWENRTDQSGTQYHFVITGRLFCGVTLRYRFLFVFIGAKNKPPASNHRRLIFWLLYFCIGTFIVVVFFCYFQNQGVICQFCDFDGFSFSFFCNDHQLVTVHFPRSCTFTIIDVCTIGV